LGEDSRREFLARRSSIIEDLIELPWQVGAVLAFLCYPGALIIAGFMASNPILKGLASVVLLLWPLFSILCGLAALKSFIRERKTRNLFKQNQSIGRIRSITWRQFESYVGEAFRQKGYFVVETPDGPDGGVDLVLRKDGEKTYVQCKHWKAYKVGVEKVRALLGSMTAGGADHGVLVTTGHFTSSAIRFGQQHGIKLVNGKDLEYMIRISPEENVLISEPIEVEMDCPICKSAMIKRMAKKGKNAGQQFWGCSKFPACKGTRNI